MATDRKTQIKKELEIEYKENKDIQLYIEKKLEEFLPDKKRRIFKTAVTLGLNSTALVAIITGVSSPLLAPLCILVLPSINNLANNLYDKITKSSFKSLSHEEEIESIKERIDLVFSLQNLKEQEKTIQKTLNLVDNYNININDRNINIDYDKEKLKDIENKIDILSKKIILSEQIESFANNKKIKVELNNKEKNILPNTINLPRISQISFDTIYGILTGGLIASLIPIPYLQGLSFLLIGGTSISIPYISIDIIKSKKEYIQKEVSNLLKGIDESLGDNSIVDNNKSLEEVKNNYITESRMDDIKELENLRNEYVLTKIKYLNKKICLEEREDKNKSDEYVNNYYLKKERIRKNLKQKVYVKTK